MLTYYNECIYKEELESFLKTFKTKHYYSSESFDKLENYQYEEIKSGDAMMANDSGSFNDVFYVKEMAVKVHSRFDGECCFEEFEFEFGTFPTAAIYDYEVLLALGNNPYMPRLLAHIESDFTHMSVVEKIQGKSLRDIEFREMIDFGKLKTFLIDVHTFIFSKNWIPMDLSASNIFVTPEGVYKLIDFSCFCYEGDFENIYDVPESTISNINEVKSNKTSLEKHVEKIIENINICLAYKEKDFAFLQNLK